jgi:ABC-2 type transport system ATP-binding protein
MTSTPRDACVRLQGLKVAFGTQRVLDGLDWSLPTGQVVGLLGRNGAGKTTLIESLLGLREPDAGQAMLFGQPSTALDDAVRARIGYVPQRSDLFEWLTADQLLAYFRSFYPRWNTAKVDGLMSRWDIARDKPISKLSGGQQQRLSIVRALAHEPELLVLDEPVASLDPAGRRDFLSELVEQVADRGTTIVFSTHILSDLERVALDVAFLTGGKIALHAPLDELLESSVRMRSANDILAPMTAPC